MYLFFLSLIPPLPYKLPPAGRIGIGDPGLGGFGVDGGKLVGMEGIDGGEIFVLEGVDGILGIDGLPSFGGDGGENIEIDGTIGETIFDTDGRLISETDGIEATDFKEPNDEENPFGISEDSFETDLLIDFSIGDI